MRIFFFGLKENKEDKDSNALISKTQGLETKMKTSPKYKN